MINHDKYYEVKKTMKKFPRMKGESETEWCLRLREIDGSIPARSTFNMINRTKTYKQFCDLRTRYNGKKAKNKKEKEEVITIEPSEAIKAVIKSALAVNPADLPEIVPGVTEEITIEEEALIDIPDEFPMMHKLEEPIKVNVINTKITKPLMHSGLTATAWSGKYGRYLYNEKHGFIDFDATEGPDLSYTVEEWKEFFKEFKTAAKLMGVDIDE